ncbi:hypothetical protein CV102_12690 [Natronococcus pandeyae]|uniref:dTMP kinase n=1 Tax=Natronococcus pandeyae TaxID=2055836 RepID=A0A8J8Q341_9EURY|nr:hypothetical protein [Natronococcus pandeyae]TYL38059.1 hypothetical protein CV102_12690 [Natronococcus pandeyae]
MSGPLLVALTGIDGAGKTTQAKRLANRFRDEGYATSYEHLTSSHFGVTSAIKDRCAGPLLEFESSIVGSNRTTDDSSVGLAGPLGLLTLVRGIWRSYLNVVRNRDADVVFLDRFLYDDLVRAAWSYGYSLDRTVPLVSIVPRPDFVCYLDLKPELAWEREFDGTTSPEEHRWKKEWYDRVVSRLDDRADIVTIDTASHDVDAVERRLYATVRDRL